MTLLYPKRETTCFEELHQRKEESIHGSCQFIIKLKHSLVFHSTMSPLFTWNGPSLLVSYNSLF